MLANGWTYLISGTTKQSVDHYTSSRILRYYLARRGIMLGNGCTYQIFGRPKESVDHYSGLKNRLTSTAMSGLGTRTR